MTPTYSALWRGLHNGPIEAGLETRALRIREIDEIASHNIGAQRHPVTQITGDLNEQSISSHPAVGQSELDGSVRKPLNGTRIESRLSRKSSEICICLSADDGKVASGVNRILGKGQLANNLAASSATGWRLWMR